MVRDKLTKKGIADAVIKVEDHNHDIRSGLAVDLIFVLSSQDFKNGFLEFPALQFHFQQNSAKTEQRVMVSVWGLRSRLKRPALDNQRFLNTFEG